MIHRICRRHHVRYTGDRCPLCPPRRGLNSHARAVQRAFRERLLTEQDERCAFHGPDGRCPVTTNLQAAHAVPYIEGGPAEGALLCPVHHRLVDRTPHA